MGLMGRFTEERGQAAVEYILVLLVLAAAVVLVVQSGAAGTTRTSATSMVCRILEDPSCGGGSAVVASPVVAAPDAGPEDYARVPEPTLAETLDAAGSAPTSVLECEALRAAYGIDACGTALPPGPLTEEQARQLYTAFSGDAGQANELLCGVDVFYAASSDLAGACALLRELTGTTAGDEAVVALGDGLREVLERERNLPLVDDLLRALEIAQGQTINGEPLDDAQRFRNVLSIAASILPADEIAQLAAIARRGNADEVAAHLDEALEQATRGADELETVARRGDDFLEGRPLWTETTTKSPAGNAYGHYRAHADDFPEAQNAVEYSRLAHDFLNHPPPGTLTKVRSNGDLVRYDPGTNTFGVLRADGAPRTLFKPEDGRAYFDQQQGELVP